MALVAEGRQTLPRRELFRWPQRTERAPSRPLLDVPLADTHYHEPDPIKFAGMSSVFRSEVARYQSARDSEDRMGTVSLRLGAGTAAALFTSIGLWIAWGADVAAFGGALTILLGIATVVTARATNARSAHAKDLHQKGTGAHGFNFVLFSNTK